MNNKSLYISVFFLFTALIAVPVIYTFGSALFDGEILSNCSLLLSKQALFLLLKSCALAFFIAIFSTIIGGILGFILYKTNILWHRFFKIALLIPLLISPYILAVAWKDFFFIFLDNTGFLTSYMGVTLVLTTVFTPLSMLIIGSALKNIDAQLEDAGMMITNFRSVVLKIILPLIKPALMTSFVLVFIFSISEFSVPAFFGVKVFTTEIFIQFSAFYNHSLAILQSALLVFICILLLLSERKYLSNAPFLSLGDKGTNSKIYLKRNQSSYLIFLSLWLFVSVVLPFLVLFVQVFKGGMTYFLKAFDLLLPTFYHSITLALIASVLIVLVGFAASYLSTIRSKKNKIKSFDSVLLIIFAIPSTILGISFIKFYNHQMLDFIYSSSLIIIIAYVGKYSFISAKLIENAIKQIPISFDEAAQIEGVSFIKRLKKIWIPLMMPSLFVAFIISFIFSFGELGTTIMLYPPGTQIMPIKVFTIMANAPQALTSSMTLIVFSITLLIIISFNFLAKLLFKAND